MAQIDKNTVESKNQLESSQYVKFFGDENAPTRIMFVGNSITRHGPKPQIGWHGDFGMAASSIENDYVHILADKISKKTNACFCICQAALWEREYKQGENLYEFYKTARNFSADIIVMRIIENCSHKDFDAELFLKTYPKFIKYLDKSEKAKLVFTSSFWKHPGDFAIEKTAKEMNSPYIYLGDLGELDEMKAIGLFEVNGVAMHPGDLGMRTIAERIFEEIEKVL